MTPGADLRDAIALVDQPPADDQVLPTDSLPSERVGRGPVRTAVWLVLTLATGLVIRLVDLNRFGFNGDEAVYAGQAASLAGNRLFTGQFPVFRAHPLLFPTLMSPLFSSGAPDLRGRIVVAILGAATIAVVYLIGRELYSAKTGVLAALILALMPYHAVVTRQVLLDGPAVLFIALSFWMFARFVRTDRLEWLAAAAATLGLGVLTKETSAVVAGSFVIFLLVSAEVRRPLRAIALTVGILALVSVVFPAAIALTRHASSGQSYLAWQLTRSSTHSATFYLTVIPGAIGWAVVIAALAAVTFRVNRTWREFLLVAWVAVPLIVFEAYPLKGYQYLLPVAPAVALLAARGLTSWRSPARWPRFDLVVARQAVTAAVVVSLLPGLLPVLFPSAGSAQLAGTGGVPGGREAGEWIGANLKPGSELMTIGPSMANILEYYGHRTAQGLSVSTNPLHRNPSYVPIANFDSSVRDGQFEFLVWDAYSALRSGSTAGRLQKLLSRYHGVPVHTISAGGRPVIIIYEVHP